MDVSLWKGGIPLVKGHFIEKRDGLKAQVDETVDAGDAYNRTRLTPQ